MKRGFKWKATLPLLTPSTCHYRPLCCYYNLFDRIVLLPFFSKSILLFIYFVFSLALPPQRAIYSLNWNYYPFYLLHLIRQIDYSTRLMHVGAHCLISLASAECTQSRKWQLNKKQCTMVAWKKVYITENMNCLFFSIQYSIFYSVHFI